MLHTWPRPQLQIYTFLMSLTFFYINKPYLFAFHLRASSALCTTTITLTHINDTSSRASKQLLYKASSCLTICLLFLPKKNTAHSRLIGNHKLNSILPFRVCARKHLKYNLHYGCEKKKILNNTKERRLV